MSKALVQTVAAYCPDLKRIAQTAGMAYPDEWEMVVRGYWQRELGEMKGEQSPPLATPKRPAARRQRV